MISMPHLQSRGQGKTLQHLDLIVFMNEYDNVFYQTILPNIYLYSMIAGILSYDIVDVKQN